VLAVRSALQTIDPKTLPDSIAELVHLSSNGDLNLNTSLDVDDDLLDGLGGGEQARKKEAC
jgi:hypothetical protein